MKGERKEDIIVIITLDNTNVQSNVQHTAMDSEHSKQVVIIYSIIGA